MHSTNNMLYCKKRKKNYYFYMGHTKLMHRKGYRDAANLVLLEDQVESSRKSSKHSYLPKMRSVLISFEQDASYCHIVFSLCLC